MSKITIIHERIVKLLTEDTYTTVQYTVQTMWQRLNWLYGDMYISIANVRQAVKLLPEGCVKKARGRLLIEPRYFEPPQ